MNPIENEPHGLAENEESHAIHFGSEDKGFKKPERDHKNDNDLAGNAEGNMFEKDVPSKNVDQSPEGFLGDFAEPQHDDLMYD